MYPAFLPGTIPYTSFQKVPWDRFCPESYFLETGSSVSKTECKQCYELEGRDTCEQPWINCHTPISWLGCSLRSLLEHYPPACGRKPSFHPGFSDSYCQVPSPDSCSCHFKAHMTAKFATTMSFSCRQPPPPPPRGIIHQYSPIPSLPIANLLSSTLTCQGGLWCSLCRRPFRAYYRWLIGHCWPPDLHEGGKCLETFRRNWATAALEWGQQIKSKLDAMAMSRWECIKT